MLPVFPDAWCVGTPPFEPVASRFLVAIVVTLLVIDSSTPRILGLAILTPTFRVTGNPLTPGSFNWYFGPFRQPNRAWSLTCWSGFVLGSVHTSRGERKPVRAFATGRRLVGGVGV